MLYSQNDHFSLLWAECLCIYPLICMLHPQCDGFFFYMKTALRNELGTFKRRHKRDRLSPPCEDTARCPCTNQEDSQLNQIYQHLDLGLPDPQNCEKQSYIV